MTCNSGNHPNPGIHVLLQCALMYLRSGFWQYVFNITFKVTVRFAVDMLSQGYFPLHLYLLVYVEYLKYSSSCKNVLLFLLQVPRQRKIMFNTTDERVMLFPSCLLMDTLWATALLISPGLMYPREE